MRVKYRGFIIIAVDGAIVHLHRDDRIEILGNTKPVLQLGLW